MTTNIPPELTTLPQWVCAWKNSKIPMQATVKKGASSALAETWSTFDTAYDAVNKGQYDNIGFVFANNGIVGIDVDCGYTDGFLSKTSTDIMSACRSYTEKSRSGRGIHVYVKGNLPFDGKNNRAGVEIYKTRRFFIVTGEKLIFEKIIENQAAIDYIVKKYFPDIEKDGENGPSDRIYSPIYRRLDNGKISTQPIYPVISQGARNLSLTSLAGMRHSQGYSKSDIYRELVRANKEACKPPLNIAEIQTIVNSVTKYRR